MGKIKSIVTLLIFGLLLTVSQHAISQTLYFCEDVDKDGYPVNESNSFTIPKKGGYLKFLVRLPDKVNSSYVNYDIYKIDYNGDEKFDNTIKQTTEYKWVWFYKEITFYDAATYKVYVYDEDDELLTSGKVKIRFR